MHFAESFNVKYERNNLTSKFMHQIRLYCIHAKHNIKFEKLEPFENNFLGDLTVAYKRVLIQRVFDIKFECLLNNV